METKDIHEKIRNLMATMDWTEYKLSKMSGLPQSTISNLVKRNNGPAFSTIEAICRTFNITLAQFFADEGEAIVLTEEQRNHLLKWGAMTNEQRDIIIRIMEQFIAN